jgi:hypothetical protein
MIVGGESRHVCCPIYLSYTTEVATLTMTLQAKVATLTMTLQANVATMRFSFGWLMQANVARRVSPHDHT